MKQDDRRKDTEQLDDNAKRDRGYTKPKLTYVEPKVQKVGDLKKFTAGFFGSFSAS